MSSNLEHHPVLTAVVPVSEPASELTTLSEWVSKIDTRLAVVLVVNKTFADSVELLAKIGTGQKSVHIIEIESAGPGSAREIGRKYCDTEFIAFWDCDDLPNYEEVLENIAGMADSTDVLIGDYSKFDVVTLKSVNLNTEANINKILHTPGIWRMIFRTQSISSIHFPDLRMAEDHVFLAGIIASGLEMKFAKTIFYRYSVGRKNQLSQDPTALSEIPLALNQIRYLLDKDLPRPVERKFLYIIYINLGLSHAKRINSITQFCLLLRKLNLSEKVDRVLFAQALLRVIYMKIIRR